MIVRGVSLREMFAQSMVVMTQPNIASFERFERSGGIREALTYVGVAAGAAALAGLIFGIFGGVGAAILGAVSGGLSVILGYAVFSALIYLAGKQFFNGTGTQDEVFYSTALYTAPIQGAIGIVSAIPVLGLCLAPVSLILGLYSVYLGYLASRASMNLTQNNAIFTAIIAFVGTFIIQAVVLAPILTLLAAILT